MQSPRVSHRWRLSPRQAVAVQQALRDRVQLEDLGEVRYVIGLGCAFTAERVLAVGVVWDLEAAEVVETRGASAPLTFPYVPGLLSFREIPVLLKVLRAVASPVDVLLCDGQGIAHPRRFGVAAHLGVLVGKPAIGCAKSRLTGRYEEPEQIAGSVSVLTDEREGTEEIGRVLRTRTAVRPVFVSPGHLCSFDDAVRVVLACCRGFRLPEPTRLADRAVAGFKRRGRFRGGRCPLA